MKVRPLEECAARYARNSTRAFLSGEQSPRWIEAVLRASASLPEALDSCVERELARMPGERAELLRTMRRLKP
jgi:hypothetical protein